ncbi:MAG: RNA polymerase sigma factor [Actinoplanes sp.]
MFDDDQLAPALAAATNGDEDGFAVLWRALQPAVLRYLWVVSGEAAEDIASETWLQAARDLHRFKGDPAAFRGWLFRIARNRAIDDRRRTSRRPAQPVESVDVPVNKTRDTASEVLERSGTAWALDLIAALPRDQAEAVMLRVVAGLDVVDAAQVLGKRPGAVRVATMRGLRKLAAMPQVQARNAVPDRLPNMIAHPPGHPRTGKV